MNEYTTADFERDLAQPFAFPGGYPRYFVTHDGAALSFNAARENKGAIVDAIDGRANDGWRVIACEINWEDSELYCDHTNEQIESVYADDDVPEHGAESDALECTIGHCDTCLSDFAQRCYSVALPVDGATTVGDVIDMLEWADVLGNDEWTNEHSAAYDAAIVALRAENDARLEELFDPSLDVIADDDMCGESVYAYFDVEFFK